MAITNGYPKPVNFKAHLATSSFRQVSEFLKLQWNQNLTMTITDATVNYKLRLNRNQSYSSETLLWH